jgi:hypothetical protein
VTQPPAPPPDLAVVAAYQAQTAALRARIDAILQQLWRSLGQYRQQDIPRFTQQVVPIVTAGQRQMSALTAGYLAAQRLSAIGRSLTVRVNPIHVSGAAARGGIDPAEVYARPFHLVWRQLDSLPHEPGAIEQAIDAGMNRAVDTAMTDLQLSKVQTSAAIGAQDGRAKWTQRVLEGPHSCGLCIVASTQRYHPSKLLPIHGGCDCSTRFIYTDADPGQLIDPERLADVHDRIEQRFGSSSSAARKIHGAQDGRGRPIHYRDVLITHEHGELGPVLGVLGEPFTGPSDL